MGTPTTSQGAAAPAINRAMRRALRHTKQPRRERNVRVPGHNPVHRAIANATLLTQPERDELMQPVRDGFQALRQGVATYAQWAAVSTGISVALTIEKIGTVRGLREHFEAAERALDAVYARVTGGAEGIAWGRRSTLYFDEIAALREAIDLHDFQLQNLSAREIHEAGRRTVQDARAAGAFIAPNAAALSQPVQEKLL
jgi:hypothetical protein